MRLNLPQQAVYWPPAGVDTFGRPTLGDPVGLRCRWEDGISETIDSSGDVVMSSAQVYLSAPVKIAGVLFLGSIDDVQGIDWESANVKRNQGTHEIIRSENIPNLKASQFLAKAYLK